MAQTDDELLDRIAATDTDLVPNTCTIREGHDDRLVPWIVVGTTTEGETVYTFPYNRGEDLRMKFFWLDDEGDSNEAPYKNFSWIHDHVGSRVFESTADRKRWSFAASRKTAHLDWLLKVWYAVTGNEAFADNIVPKEPPKAKKPRNPKRKREAKAGSSTKKKKRMSKRQESAVDSGDDSPEQLTTAFLKSTPKVKREGRQRVSSDRVQKSVELWGKFNKGNMSAQEVQNNKKELCLAYKRLNGRTVVPTPELIDECVAEHANGTAPTMEDTNAFARFERAAIGQPAPTLVIGDPGCGNDFESPKQSERPKAARWITRDEILSYKQAAETINRIEALGGRRTEEDAHACRVARYSLLLIIGEEVGEDGK